MAMVFADTLPQNPKRGALAPRDPSRSAEADSLELGERKARFAPLQDFLNNTCNKIERIDREARLKIMRRMVKSFQYYDGHQYGRVTDEGIWKEEKTSPGDIAYVDNQFKYHVDTALTEMARARIELEITASSDDTDMEEAAQYASGLLEAARARLLRPSQIIRENLYLLLAGISFRYTYYAMDSPHSPIERMPITENRQINGGAAASVCAICALPKPDFQQDQTMNQNPLANPCPGCGSDQTVRLQAAPLVTPVIIGYRDVPAGETMQQIIDPLLVNVYLGARSIAESPYLLFKQLIMRSVLEDAFPNRIIPSTGTKAVELRYHQGMERGSAATGATSSWTDDTDQAHGQSDGGEQFELLEFDQVWLEPHLYSAYELPQEAALASGLRLARGARLIEIFPEGMYIARVGTEILDLWHEKKSAKWSSASCGLRPSSMYGAGLASLHSLQDIINDLRSFQMANVFYNGSPREFVDTNYLEGGKLSADPSIATQVSNLPAGAGIIGSAFAIAPSAPLSPEAYGIEETVKGSMQAQAGTFSFNSGAPDVRGALGTATGIEAMREQQVGRRAPDLWLKTEMEQEQAYQILELIQENWTRERHLKNAGRGHDAKAKGFVSYKQAGIEAFLNARLRSDFQITVVQDSWIPKTSAQRKAALQAFVPFLQIPNEEVQALAASEFGVPLEIGGWTATQREAMMRLCVFATVAEALSEATGGDEQAESHEELVSFALEQANCPVDALLDNHKAFIDYYVDWHTSDEGREASTLLKAMVHSRVEEHYQGETALQKFLKSEAMQLQALDQVGQMAVDDANAQAGLEHAQAAHEQGTQQALQQAQLMQMMQAQHRQGQQAQDDAGAESSSQKTSMEN